MRSFLLLIVAVLCLNYNAHTQRLNKKATGWELGASIGLNTSWILNQNAFEILQKVCPEDALIIGSEPNYRLTPGISFGGNIGYHGEKIIGFQAEVNYTFGGQNYKDSWLKPNACVEHDLSDFKRKFRLHYLNVPLMMKLQTRNIKKTKAYGLIGVQVGFLLGANERITLSGSEPEGVAFTPVSEKVKKLDAGLVFGGGIDYFLAKDIYLNMGFKSYFGAIDINGDAVRNFISANDESYQTSRNFTFGIHLGIHFILDGRSMYR